MVPAGDQDAHAFFARKRGRELVPELRLGRRPRQEAGRGFRQKSLLPDLSQEHFAQRGHLLFPSLSRAPASFGPAPACLSRLSSSAVSGVSELQGRDHLHELGHRPPAVRRSRRIERSTSFNFHGKRTNDLIFHVSSHLREGMICARSRSRFPARRIESPSSILAARSCLDIGGTGPSSGMANVKWARPGGRQAASAS